MLNIDDNQFSGALPDCDANAQLQALHVSNDGFSGAVGANTELRIVDRSNNPELTDKMSRKFLLQCTGIDY